MNRKEFGYNFLGPMLSEYSKALALENDPDVYCLAREGHFFQKIINELKSKGLVSSKIKSQYLKVSRAILFRVCLGDESTWQFSLTPKFDGTLKELLRYRFGLGQLTLTELFTDESENVDVSLPDDYDVVTNFFKTNISVLQRSVEQSKEAYVSYLKSIDFGKNKTTPVVLDVGYSGTIQKLLTHLMGVNTKGIYFIASKPGVHEISGNKAEMIGVFKEGVKLGDGHIMLDRSLFIESLLTAPQGQLVDIRKNPLTNNFEFFYGSRAKTQQQFYLLEEVMAGAIECVCHCFENKIRYTTDELDKIYETYVTKPNMIPTSVRHLFEIDDAISGNANITSNQLFQL